MLRNSATGVKEEGGDQAGLRVGVRVTPCHVYCTCSVAMSEEACPSVVCGLGLLCFFSGGLPQTHLTPTLCFSLPQPPAQGPPWQLLFLLLHCSEVLPSLQYCLTCPRCPSHQVCAHHSTWVQILSSSSSRQVAGPCRACTQRARRHSLVLHVSSVNEYHRSQ